MYKIRSELLAEKKSYAACMPDASGELLDCSLGVNPYGFPYDAVKDAVSAFDLNRFNGYPHSHAAEDAVAALFGERAGLGRKNILVTEGSIGALYIALAVFASAGAEIVGFAPTFTDAAEYIRSVGMVYTAVPLEAERCLKQDAGALEKAISPRTSAVYIDNPNNPTGQVMPLRRLTELLTAARENGACLIVDEAYGDFLPRSESAVNLLERFDNLIVVRSMSKGFGLAGIRAGYIVSSDALAGHMRKISNPYMANELTREIMGEALRHPEFTVSHSADFEEMKRELRKHTGGRLFLSATDDRVPIFTLIHVDPDADLQRILSERGLLSVSGREFDNMGGNMVRLRLPEKARFPRLLSVIAEINGGA